MASVGFFVVMEVLTRFGHLLGERGRRLGRVLAQALERRLGVLDANLEAGAAPRVEATGDDERAPAAEFGDRLGEVLGVGAQDVDPRAALGQSLHLGGGELELDEARVREHAPLVGREGSHLHRGALAAGLAAQVRHAVVAPGILGPGVDEKRASVLLELLLHDEGVLIAGVAARGGSEDHKADRDGRGETDEGDGGVGVGLRPGDDILELGGNADSSDCTVEVRVEFTAEVAPPTAPLTAEVAPPTAPFTAEVAPPTAFVAWLRPWPTTPAPSPATCGALSAGPATGADALRGVLRRAAVVSEAALALRRAWEPRRRWRCPLGAETADGVSLPLREPTPPIPP